MLQRILLVCAVCGLAGFGDVQANYLSTFQTISQILTDGFPAETHHVTTSDGYILEMHRIPHGRNAQNVTAKRPVVFIMHGLMGASNGFIALGANNSFAYNLADEGFDVWMGNARGNYHSRAHASLNPDDPIEKFAFFNFTFEHIGLYDLPVMIDYALEHTGNEKLQYVGHSQGGTSFMVLTSTKTEYNKKLASVHLLAGVGYQEYFPNEYLAEQAAYGDIIYAAAYMNGIVELTPDVIAEFLPSGGYRTSDNCIGTLEQKYLCELYKVRNILRSESSFESIVPAGGSLKQVAHFAQNIRDKLFRRYDYGIENNKHMYGSEDPPIYELSKISCNVTMHYSMNDNLLDERDVLAMVAALPNARARRVARESFTHTDYIASLDARDQVMDSIVADLKYVAGISSGIRPSLNVYLAVFGLILMFTTSTNTYLVY